MPMKIETMENGHTRIRVSNDEKPVFESLLNHFIKAHGGKLSKQTKKYTYYEIYKNLLFLRSVAK